MQLLYIWVENFRCFKNNEFNFSSQYKFKFDHDSNVMCISCFDYNTLLLFKNNIKDNIQDLTVIVGENGVGKTTLSDLLLSPVNLSGSGSKRIYILRDDKRIYCYCAGEWGNDTSIKVDFDNVSTNQSDEIRKLMLLSNDRCDMSVLESGRVNNLFKEESIKLQNTSHRTLDFFMNKDISLIYNTNAFSYQSELKNNEYSATKYIDVSLGGTY